MRAEEIVSMLKNMKRINQLEEGVTTDHSKDIVD